MPFQRPLDASQLLTTTPPDEICLGVDFTGKTIYKSWQQFVSILILGLMGGGKTNTAAWIILQEVRHGARLALIDKHARSDESLHSRLKALTSSYDTPLGDTPASSMRVINHVRNVLTSRMNGGSVIYRLLLVIDEFTAIMRALKDHNSEWNKVAISLQGLIEDLNYEGRKYGVHVVCVGQAANASRAGGTEVRDLFHTRLVHAMRSRQAQLLGLTEEKHDIQRLEPGQVYIDVEGRDDPFPVQVPLVTQEFMRSVAVPGAFIPGSLAETESTVNQLVHLSERENGSLENGSSNLSERVLDLYTAGWGKGQIIESVWKVKKGGSERYRQAEREYEQIIRGQAGNGQL